MLVLNTTCVTTLGIMTRGLIAPPSFENYFTYKVKFKGIGLPKEIVLMGEFP
jgi:hypothetical protein